ncbi:MAG: hypothetical protein AB7E09_02125 [Candidatus Izemoplasmatales bacterium]
MKALKTKVILSGIVLVFAFIATIGTTFAWFTVSQTATVDTLTLNVTAADNLLIRVRPYDTGAFTTPGDIDDVNTYQTSITNTNLTDNGYDLTWGLQPSTIIDNGYTSFDATTLSYIANLDDQDRTLTSATRNSSTGHYIELQFYLFSQSDEAQVIEMAGMNISAVTAENNATGQNNVEDAVRLSAFSGEASGTHGTPLVFGNDTDYDYAFTANNAGYLSSGTASTLTAPDYFNSISDLNTAITGLLTSVIDLTNYVDGDDNANLLTIQPNTATLVSVLIYIEGWDLQAANDIIEAQFNISFGFEFGA